MAIRWTPDLAVGIEEIDRQHQKLFEIVDQLLEAMNAGKGRSEVSYVLDFLGSYVDEHFGLEERRMAEVGDPNARQHKAEHAAFIATFEQLKQTHARDGASSALVIEVNNRVCGWLRSHIMRTDPTLRAAIDDHAATAGKRG